MEKNFSEYLTIGEVSKLKNVSIKSLRYYDDIGILKPSYTNPDTGYRYYLAEQLPMLNIISFCTEVGISLKDWNKYLDGQNNFRLDKLLVDARQLATQKLQAIQNGLAHIERTEKKMSSLNLGTLKNAPYRKTIPQRDFLYIEVDKAPRPKEFLHYRKQLFHMIHELNLNVTSYYPAGVFMDFTKESKKYFVFIEIDEPVTLSNHYRHIEEGAYLCFHLDESGIGMHSEMYPDYFKQVSSGTVIETDLINHTFQCNNPVMELQYLLP